MVFGQVNNNTPLFWLQVLYWNKDLTMSYGSLKPSYGSSLLLKKHRNSGWACRLWSIPLGWRKAERGLDGEGRDQTVICGPATPSKQRISTSLALPNIQNIPNLCPQGPRLHRTCPVQPWLLFFPSFTHFPISVFLQLLKHTGSFLLRAFPVSSAWPPFRQTIICSGTYSAPASLKVHPRWVAFPLQCAWHSVSKRHLNPGMYKAETLILSLDLIPSQSSAQRRSLLYFTSR